MGVNFFAQEHDKRTPQELDYGIINSEDIRLTFGSPSIIVLLFMFCYHEKYAFAPDAWRKRSLTEKNLLSSHVLPSCFTVKPVGQEHWLPEDFATQK